jgi:alpha-L-fucosidase 2
VQYLREVFASAADDVIVIRLTSDKPGCISGVVSVRRDPRSEREKLVASGSDRLIMTGQACQGVRPRNPEVLKYVKESDLKLYGVKFAAHYQVVTQNGKLSAVQDSKLGPGIRFESSDAVTIYFTAVTDYNKKDPYAPLEYNLSGKCDAILKRAVAKEFQALKSDSVAAHSEAFSRVDLSLGKSDRAHLPTDERIRAVTDESPDTELEALLYQYGRYLLICSSRKGTQTMGLKGIWATGTKCSWNGDYHININQQMNYWPAETGNLSEFHDPFFTMVEGLLPAGRKLAREALGCRGFMAVHTTDPYFYTSIHGKLKYGMWVVGGAWCSAHLMEHYRFTGDTEFLKKRAFPILKECSLFFLDWLVEDPETGKLVSGPTCSPENRFYIAGQDSRSGGQVSMGPAMDQEVVWETFTNYLDALQELGIEDELSDEVRQALAQLDLPKIGKDGRILEWGNDEFVEVDPGHRHVSHLYAVYPGFQFSWNKTPRLMAAAKKSLEHRLANDGGQTGWSRAWTINFWARFLEGDKAHDNLVIALKNNSYDNLFNVNPPFIIDGNFGYASGIAEMLLQSHAGELHLLPALPAAWPQGAVKGLCARGGFEVDLQWNSGKLVSGRIQSKLGKDCTVHYGDTVKTFQTQKGVEYDLKGVLGL